MCGIIGYTGSADAVPKMLKGLSVLEYRGYDSVGIAVQSRDGVAVTKCRGRIHALEERLRDQPLPNSHCAVGHTRWATHGGPSDENAHPHRVGSVTLVHNGIIENYEELARELSGKGVRFHSETDTEVAAALLNACYADCREPRGAIRAATDRMCGAYAFAILFEDREGEVWVIRRGSPLLLAKGADGYYLASDMTALLPFAGEYAAVEEGEIFCLTPVSAERIDEGGVGEAMIWKPITMTPESAQKGGFSHFMLKEIHEQPQALRNALSPRLLGGIPDFSADGIDEAFWRQVTGVQIVACGSAMHAGLIGAELIEAWAGVPATVHIASEYRYRPPIAREGTLVIVVSQSGETADSLAALRDARARGLSVLAVVNVVESSIAREADRRIYTYAGPEIAVATTKGYCTQVGVLALIAVAMAHANQILTDGETADRARMLLQESPAMIERMLAYGDCYERIAKGLLDHRQAFYIGRGTDYALALEGALKLKEISYLHAEAYAAGELKHGTISLIEAGTPVLALATEESLFEKTESNIREVHSRGAQVTVICAEGMKLSEDRADCILRLPACSPVASRFAAMTAVQMIAFETARLLGRDIDRPRNLAKSVTVE